MTTTTDRRLDFSDLPPVLPLWPVPAQAWMLGRSAAYDLARRGEFPCPVVLIGSRYRVITADLLASLHIGPDQR